MCLIIFNILSKIYCTRMNKRDNISYFGETFYYLERIL